MWCCVDVVHVALCACGVVYMLCRWCCVHVVQVVLCTHCAGHVVYMWYCVHNVHVVLYIFGTLLWVLCSRCITTCVSWYCMLRTYMYCVVYQM